MPATCTADTSNWYDRVDGAHANTYFRIGLFGNSLTDFKADCTTSENCNVSDYFEFDGWAIGTKCAVPAAITHD